MNKKKLFIILGVIAVILIVFWLVKSLTEEPIAEGPTVETPTPEDMQEQEPYIKGKIVAISGNEILIAEGLEGEQYDGDIDKLKGSAAWFAIGEETEITGLEEQVFSSADLEIGQTVEVWNIGVVLETYPAQGDALKINLVEVLEEKEEKPEEEKEEQEEEDEEEKKETAKKCYTGGCSGELCTDDPEVISTCEILPGMECLAEGVNCQLVNGECKWVLSEEAAVCFLAVKEKQGDQVLQSRIGNLFRKAEELLNQ